MILVTGASGTIGSDVVRLLAQRGFPVRAMTRDRHRLGGSVPPEVEVVGADFTEPESLDQALHDVDRVFALTAPGAWIPDHDLALIAAARRAGAAKVVKLSAIGGDSSASADSPSDWHAPGERALSSSGLAWVALRPTWFASNALAWAEPIRTGTPIPNFTGDGMQAVIDPRDIAATVVEALTTNAHDGAAYTLTGPEPLSVPAMVAQLATALGRPLEMTDLPADSAREMLLGAGLDPSTVEVAVAGYKLVRAGGNAVRTDDVRRILGREPRSFRDWIADNRAAFLRTAHAGRP